MSKKVVIVDDSLYMRTLIKDALEEAGFEIVGQAADGETAIDMILESNPDIITLDNILPDMLGLDIIKALRAEGNSSKIVMVSAVGQQSVINAGMELGASDYIVKPFTPEKLRDVVEKATAA